MDFHVKYTHSSHKYDPKTFSISTLKRVTSAYLRIFDTIDGVALSSKRIISNTYYVFTSIKYIVEDKGCIIPDVNNVKNSRNVRVKVVWGGKYTNYGGKRVRMLAEDD